jgi:ferritin-like metal-binding protein YciE
MEKMQDLKDLLKHEIQDLYSAETQLIEALPKMADKAKNAKLKNALQQHLKVTKIQKNRLNQIMKSFDKDWEGQSEEPGVLSRLFGGSSAAQKCIGMEAIIKEGETIMGEEMNSDVMDAAIIGAAQKAEHYEICGYGTCKAYARELELGDIAKLLDQTLEEEYEADNLLTDLAVMGGLNEEADKPGEKSSGRRRIATGSSENKRRSAAKSASGGRSQTAGKSSSSSGRGAVSKKPASKTASEKSTASKSSNSRRSSSGTVLKASIKSKGGYSTASKRPNKASSPRSKSSPGKRK